MVFGSLTGYLIFRLVLSVAGRNESYFSRRTFWILFSSLAAALLLAVSPTFWLYSLVAKAYPQLTFWILAILLLLFRWRNEVEKSPPDFPLSPRGQSLLFAAAFLFGLSLGTYGAMSLYLPAFLSFCLLSDRRWYRDPKILLLGLFFLLLGFSVYLYLPLRSSTTPFLDWGEPRTFSRFLNHLSDAKDAGHNISFPFSSLGKLSWKSFKVLMDQFTLFGILLGGIGAVALFFKDRAFFWLTFGIAFIHWLFFVRLWGMAFLYIPLFLIVAIWIGVGIFSLGKALEVGWKGKFRAEFRSGFTLAFCGGIFIILLLQFYAYQPSSGKKNYYVPYEVGKEMLLSLPPNSILFSYHSSMIFSGLQGVENFRPDVFVAVTTPLRAPHLFWSLDKAHYPVFDFEALQGVVRPDSIAFFTRIFAAHIGKYPLYWDHSPENEWLVSRLVAERLLYRIQEKESPLPDKIWAGKLREAFEIYRSILDYSGFMEDEEGKRFLKTLIAARGTYYLHRGFLPPALACNRVALKLMGEDAILYNNLGILMRSMGRGEEALKSWERAIDLNPVDPSPRINRAAFFYQQGDYTRALQEWEEAIRLGGQGVLAYYYRAMALRAKGKSEEALSDLQTFLEKSFQLSAYFGDDPIFENARKLMQEISAELSSKGTAAKPAS